MGAGNLGLALADYPGFRQEGFEIAALFDTLKEKVGQQSRGGVPIYDIHDLKKVSKREGIRIAVIAVPAPSAQHVLGLVVAAGIKAVLNFSPGALQVPPDVKLKSVDLTVSLESLSFFLAQGDGDESKVKAERRGKAGRRRRREAASHVDARGRVKMVDVGDKPVTSREAVARGSITMSREALRAHPHRRGEERRPAADRPARRHPRRQADLRAHPALPSAARSPA